MQDYDFETIGVIDTPDGSININGLGITIPGAVKALVLKAVEGREPIAVYIQPLDAKEAEEYEHYKSLGYSD
jgi:hypothetical protein